MRGHDIRFHGEIRKITLSNHEYPLLSGALIEPTFLDESVVNTKC